MKSTKEEIVEKADQLFYQQGFESTSFSDIAQMLKISRGNFYHHFKTKDEILSSVLHRREEKVRQMLEAWEVEAESPSQRIRSFISILLRNMTDIKRYGCPIGSMCTELGKLKHSSQGEANHLFDIFRDWLKVQFGELGFEKDAEKYALHLLARSQGIAALTQAYQDDDFVRYEVDLLMNWLDELEKN